MIRSYRTQVDELGDLVSAEAVTLFEGPDAINKARQEFAKDADVNHIVAKYGIDAFNKNHTYGEINFDLDLASALRTVQQGRETYDTLPLSIRQKYTFNSPEFLKALADGTLGTEIDALAKPPAKPPEPPTPEAPPTP